MKKITWDNVNILKLTVMMGLKYSKRCLLNRVVKESKWVDQQESYRKEWAKKENQKMQRSVLGAWLTSLKNIKEASVIDR